MCRYFPVIDKVHFYHYVIPGMPLDRSGDAPHTHSKICAGIYMNNDNPGLRGIWGSFNPSYNMSLTHEIGVTISGLLTNKFISVLTRFDTLWINLIPLSLFQLTQLQINF